jgi:hypothetical protein
VRRARVAFARFKLCSNLTVEALAMKNPNIVFDAITVTRQTGIGFDVWYANHYLPALRAAGGGSRIRCYGSPVRATYLAVLETSADDTAAKLPQPAHELIVAAERYGAQPNGGQMAAGVTDAIFDADILYPVFFRVPPAREAEFDRWYDEEHLDMLLRCPYWPACRRYRVQNPGAGAWTHVALHYLTDLRALESPERAAARSTPWRARLDQEAWFRGEYHPYYRCRQLGA